MTGVGGSVRHSLVRRPLAVGLTLAVTAVLAAQSSFAAPQFPTAKIWAAATDTCTAKDDCRTARESDTIVATDAQGIAVGLLTAVAAVLARPGRLRRPA